MRKPGWQAGDVIRILFLCAGLLLLAGCATPQTDALLAAPGNLPDRAEVKGVPVYEQETDLCGPAALAMAMTWSGKEIRPKALVPLVFTPGRAGSLQTEMLTAARRKGRLSYPISGLRELFAEVAAGHPVVVLENLTVSWAPQWHYAVVVGYDLDRREVRLHNGTDAPVTRPLAYFEHVWSLGSYWGFAVLPPDVLPATTTRDRYITAAAGLERAGSLAEAVAAYGTALAQWPGDYRALVGLGNSRYGLGDYAAAAEAFRKATLRHPERAPAYNNLADVLNKLGRYGEAAEAAHKAIALGGPYVDVYRQTLKEIEAARASAAGS